MGKNKGYFMAVQLFDSETASQLVSIAGGVSFRKRIGIINIRGNPFQRAKGLTLIFPEIHSHFRISFSYVILGSQRQME